MSIAMLGYGRFGSALADLLVQAGHRVHIVDPQARVPEALTPPSAAPAIEEARWVILAMPVPRMREALQAILPWLRPHHTVIDVGSVKLHPCMVMDELLGEAIPHVGTHPLFGPLSLARGERPLRVVLCASASQASALARTRELFETLGCEVIERDPSSHDRAMAETHALAFFIAKALVAMGVGEDLSMAPPSFLGLANMLAAVRSDAGHLFAAIQRENPYASRARRQLLQHLTTIDQQLLTADDDGNAMGIPPSDDAA